MSLQKNSEINNDNRYTKKWQRFSNLIHIANKAGKIKLGMSASCSSCIKHKARLVICATDMSSGSKQKIMNIADTLNVKLVTYGYKEQFSETFQRNVVGIITIEDKNFASGILKALS